MSLETNQSLYNLQDTSMMFLSKVYHLLLIGGVVWLLQVAGSTAEDLGSTQNQQGKLRS